MRDVEGTMDVRLRISECLPTLERRAAFSDRLFRFLEGREYHRIELRWRSALRGFGLPYPGARTRLIGKAPLD